jgi:emp24/gp25L/p24 family/GOLD
VRRKLASQAALEPCALCGLRASCVLQNAVSMSRRPAPGALLLAAVASLTCVRLATALVFDVGAHGRQFCFNRDAHEGEGVSLRYAVHRPRGATVRVAVRSAPGEGPVQTLFDGPVAEHGLAEFRAPHTGSFKVCISSGSKTSYITSVSIAALVKGRDIELEGALSRGEVHGAGEIAHAVAGIVTRILYQQDAFREAVWRHDLAMYESGRMAERASVAVCVLVFVVSTLQVRYVHRLLTAKAGRGGNDGLRRRV